MRRLSQFAIAAIVSAMLASTARADTCSLPAITTAAAGLGAARIRLIALPAGDDFETAVAPKARAAIADMKSALGTLIAAVMRCRPLDADTGTIAAELSRLGHAGHEEQPENSSYGWGLKFAVRRFAQNRIGITAEFEIKCGVDTLLSVFVGRDGGWLEALRIQSDPYKAVSGGFWSFDYALSPPDAASHWFAAMKSVAPWCSSTWSSIRYAAYRPTADPLKPKKIFGASDPIWWGGEDMGTLRAGVADFDLRFHAQSIDDGVHNREWIRHFSVVGDTVLRIAPLAATIHDFVDEWIVLAWNDAARWTVPASVARLETLHAKLHKKPYYDFVSVRSCDPDRVQVEIEETDGPHTYFRVLTRGGYVMADVSTAADPTCRGPNRFDINKLDSDR